MSPVTNCSVIAARLSVKPAPTQVANRNASDHDADFALVDRARDGDLSAFRDLVEKYQQRAHSIALGVLGNYQDAEDATQEAFVKAYRNLHLFRGQSSFYTWLYRIVFNLSIDIARKRYRHLESNVGDMHALDAPAQSSTASHLPVLGHVAGTEEEFESKELGKEIQKAMENLSPEHRMVIILREVDGLSYTEISDVVGCSKGTVMSRLHHARKRLQQALADFAPAFAHSNSAHDTDVEQEDEEREVM